MHRAVVNTSLVAETVTHAVDRLLLAMDSQSLETVQCCGEIASGAVVEAYHKQVEQRGVGKAFINEGDWIRVLQALILRAVPRALAFLQRVQATPKLGLLERGVSTSLVHLVFCTLTLSRCLGPTFFFQRQQQEHVGVVDGARALVDGKNMQLLPVYNTLRQELGAVLGAHFAFIAYNADQQLWRLEAAGTSFETLNIPLMHTVPQMPLEGAWMEDGCWMWLLLEASTSDMLLSSYLLLENKVQEDASWVVRALLDMNPHDTFNAPFARKLVDILLAVYIFFLKLWMMRFPGLSKVLQCWSRKDDMKFFLSSLQLLHGHEETNIRGSSTIRNGKRSVEEVWMLAEVCIVLRGLARRAHCVFHSPCSLLKLQRLLSQLTVTRLFFAVQRPLGSPDAADMLSVELSALVEIVYDGVFVCCDQATCTFLPCEASVPHVQLALFDVAAHAIEVHTNTRKALLERIRQPPLLAALRYAYTVGCVGVGVEDEVEKNAVAHGMTGTLKKVCTLFLQSFLLGVEEVFSYLHLCGFPVEDAVSLQHFFKTVREGLHATLVVGDGLKFISVLSGEPLAAVEHVLSMYRATTGETLFAATDNEVLSKHRCYWLLAVSYLRIADLEALMQHALGSSLTSQAGDNGIYWYCQPSESLHWMHLDDQGSCCSNYREWIQLYRRAKRGANMCSNVMSSCSVTLRSRVIFAAVRFFMLALCESIRAELTNETGADAPCESQRAALGTRESASQSTLYVTTFIRFLMTMEHLSAAEVVQWAELSSRVISVWASAERKKSSSNSYTCPLSTEEESFNRVTEEDVTAAQTYQLALSLFVI